MRTRSLYVNYRNDIREDLCTKILGNKQKFVETYR